MTSKLFDIIREEGVLCVFVATKDGTASSSMRRRILVLILRSLRLLLRRSC